MNRQPIELSKNSKIGMNLLSGVVVARKLLIYFYLKTCCFCHSKLSFYLALLGEKLTIFKKPKFQKCLLQFHFLEFFGPIPAIFNIINDANNENLVLNVLYTCLSHPCQILVGLELHAMS